VRSDSGYIGSFIVHLAVIGVAILFSRMQPDVREVDEQDPLLLEIWQGDGSERDPGIPGRDRGIAEGAITGDKSKMGLGAKGFTRVKVLNADKLLKDMKEADAKAAAEAKAESAKEAKSADKSDPSAKSDKVSSKEKWTPDFLKNGQSKTSGKASTTGSKSTGGSSGTHGIKGSNVGGEGTGHGTGKDGFGRTNGHGKNGGDGGSGNAEKLFIGDVRGKFADIFIPLFREQGGDLSADKDSGVVKVLVSPSGLVSFAGWHRRPGDALVERLVEESIRKMPPVRTPPGGEEIIVRIEVSGKVE
jgi:hypothetical protein